MADEKFSITKFLGSFAQWLPWVKTARFMLGALLIIGIIFTIYKAFFSKQQQQTQHVGAVTVQSGGTFIGQKQEAPKKVLSLFVEPYVFAEAGFSHDDGGSRAGVGVRGGFRWEF